MKLATQEDIDQILDLAGKVDDGEIHLTDTALAIAAQESLGISIERYQIHIQKMIEEVSMRYKELLVEGASDDAKTKLAALKHVIHNTHGYEGDSENYDDLQNVNLIRVIERRKGMPVAISLLYIHVGLAQNWDVAALNFPAHVVCRIDDSGERILFDPFHQCKILQAPDLRNLLKTLVSPQAELIAEYYEVASKRELLTRLQNNIKLRQIEMEEYSEAVKTIETMRRIDPAEYRLLLDAGVLYARTNQALAAVDALERYIELTPSTSDRQEALMLLQQIRENLH